MPSLLEPQEAPEHGKVLLRTGAIAEIRPLGAADRPLVRDLVRRESPEALERRFLGRLSEETAVEALLAPPAPDSLTLAVIATPPGGHPELVAVGSIGGTTRPDTAEVAVLVDDAWAHRGLATLLMERLALCALRRGRPNLVALVRRDNHAMLELLREIGFPCTISAAPDSPGEVVVRLLIEATPEAADRFAGRDRIATGRSMAALFQPRAVAVAGASRNPLSIGRKIFDNLAAGGFPGPVYPVNPAAEAIGATPAYHRVADLPDGVDLLVVAVPAAAVESVLEEAGQRRIPMAVIITAGFAEVGEDGRDLQERIVGMARRTGLRLVGPNCLGIVNTAATVRLNASFLPFMPSPGPIAMASQSGALGLAMLAYAEEHQLGISSFVSVGNKADVSTNDLLQHWEDDPATRVIVLYLESFGNPRRFARLARRVGRKKPVLLVKAARTAAGGRAAASHTAALLSSEAAVDALVAETGLVRADTLEELFEAAQILSRQPLPPGPRVAVITNGGGPGILAADALSTGGLETPPPPDDLRARLAQAIPGAASLGNPFDLIASGGAEAYRAALRGVLADPTYDAVLVIFIPVDLANPNAVLSVIRDETQKAHRAGHAKPVVACVMGRPEAALDAESVSIPVYRFPESAARALAAARRYAVWRALPDTDHAPVGFPGFDLSAARALVRTALAHGDGWMDPLEAFRLLEAIGVPHLMPERAPNALDGGRLAAQLGKPVAVKIASRTLLHKSDWGGVALGVEGAQAVAAACEAMSQRLQAAGQAEALEGFLIQPMAPSGVECLIGVSADPVFGPVIAFGLGGTDVEALNDLTFGLPPLTPLQAERMVAGIRAHALLENFRHRAEADEAAVVDALLRISLLADHLPEVQEIDLNPVVVLPRGQGLKVVDARIRLARPEPR
jgi:acetyl coenzyme A synthetase (ADP forming)-like protein